MAETITTGADQHTRPGMPIDAAPMTPPEVKIPSAFQIVVKGKDGQMKVVKEGKFALTKSK
jgi:hypothetical protein